MCTTELGAFAKAKSEFDKRNTKLIGLSVDSVESHKGWAGDIDETQVKGLFHARPWARNMTDHVDNWPSRR